MRRPHLIITSEKNHVAEVCELRKRMENTESLAGYARRLLRRWLTFSNSAVAPLAFLKFHECLQKPRAVESRHRLFGDKNLPLAIRQSQEFAKPNFPSARNHRHGV